MPPDERETQGKVKLSVLLTREQRHRVRVVASHLEKSISDVMCEYTLEQVDQMYADFSPTRPKRRAA